MTHPLTSEAEPRSDTTTANGAANAAEIQQSRVSTKVDVFVDTSAAATLTVEVSTDGSTWRQSDTNDYGAAATDLRQYDLAYPYVRAYLDTATNTVEVVGRGV